MLGIKYPKDVLIIIAILHVINGQRLYKKELVAVHKWSYFEMGFPNADVLQTQINMGQYLNTKVLPVDFAIEYNDKGFGRVFLTFPRLNIGVPYSLALVVANQAANKNVPNVNAKVQAYPNYEWHYNYSSNCSGITSAIRIFIDVQQRLWVIDSGQINSIQCCPPQILGFNLINDTLIHQYTIPHNLFIPGLSVFTDLHVDVPEEDENAAMLYITDTWGYGIIVYNALQRRAWRIEHEFMKPDESLKNSNLSNDGIFTVSLSPKTKDNGERKLYFHALNSYDEVSIPLHLVNNASIWLNNTQDRSYVSDEFSIIGNRGTQCESEVIDSEGNMFCSLLNGNSIIKWDGVSPYNSDNLQVVVYNPEQIKFVTSLKALKNPNGYEELWALSQEPTLFVGGHINKHQIKFMLLGCRMENLLNNTECSIG